MKVVLVSWSHVDLAFKKVLEKNICTEFTYFKFTHHVDWNTSKRSRIKNIIHILIQLIYVFRISRKARVIYFGTNLCRLLFPFSNNISTYFIYNELPSTSFGVLTIYDRLVFYFSKNIFVSSESRSVLLNSIGFKTKHVGILENITFSEIRLTNLHQKNSWNKAILIGTIDKTRFGIETRKHLNALAERGLQIDVLPSRIDFGTDIDSKNIQFLNPVPHDQVLDLIEKYDIGILAYEPVSDNNIYAAPLKLYEYVNAQLRILSLFPNIGIDSVKEKFPALFTSYNFDSEFDIDTYLDQRNKFLCNALASNLEFAKLILS